RVGAGLRDDIPLTARGAPVLGWEDARLHLKLGDRVDGGRVTQAAVVGVDVGSAIQEKRRIVGAASGYAEAADRSLTILVLLDGAAAGVGAGNQQSELQQL